VTLSTTGAVRDNGRCRDDRGTGVIASVFGVTMFLGFTLFTTQVAVHLLAVTTIDAETHDTARRIAKASVQRADPTTRRATINTELDRLGDRFRRWDPDPTIDLVHHPDQIVLRVRVDPPNPVLAGADRLLGIGTIERTARIRREDR
jgi:hypothetical protein